MSETRESVADRIEGRWIAAKRREDESAAFRDAISEVRRLEQENKRLNDAAWGLCEGLEEIADIGSDGKLRVARSIAAETLVAFRSALNPGAPHV